MIQNDMTNHDDNDNDNNNNNIIMMELEKRNIRQDQQLQQQQQEKEQKHQRAMGRWKLLRQAIVSNTTTTSSSTSTTTAITTTSSSCPLNNTQAVVDRGDASIQRVNNKEEKNKNDTDEGIKKHSIHHFGGYHFISSEPFYYNDDTTTNHTNNEQQQQQQLYHGLTNIYIPVSVVSSIEEQTQSSSSSSSLNRQHEPSLILHHPSSIDTVSTKPAATTTTTDANTNTTCTGAVVKETKEEEDDSSTSSLSCRIITLVQQKLIQQLVESFVALHTLHHRNHHHHHPSKDEILMEERNTTFSITFELIHDNSNTTTTVDDDDDIILQTDCCSVNTNKIGCTITEDTNVQTILKAIQNELFEQYSIQMNFISLSIIIHNKSKDDLNHSTTRTTTCGRSSKLQTGQSVPSLHVFSFQWKIQYDTVQVVSVPTFLVRKYMVPIVDSDISRIITPLTVNTNSDHDIDNINQQNTLIQNQYHYTSVNHHQQNSITTTTPSIQCPSSSSSSSSSFVTFYTREREQQSKQQQQQNTKIPLKELVSHLYHDNVDNTGNICVWDCEKTITYLLLQYEFYHYKSLSGQQQTNHNTTSSTTSSSSFSFTQQSPEPNNDNVTILELGAGMAGLAGLSLYQFFLNSRRSHDQLLLDSTSSSTSPPKTKQNKSKINIIITDGHMDCVRNNRINIQLCQAATAVAAELPSQSERIPNHHHHHHTNVSIDCQYLKWMIPNEFCYHSTTTSTCTTEKQYAAHYTLISDCIHFVEYHTALLYTCLFHTIVNGTIWFCQPNRGTTVNQFLQLIQSMNQPASNCMENNPIVTIEERTYDEIDKKHATFLLQRNNNNGYIPDKHKPRLIILTKVRELTEEDYHNIKMYKESSNTK